MQILKESFRWLIGWLYYVALTCLAGAVLGVLSHVVLGPLFVDDRELAWLAAFGFLNGLKYGSVWAGGLAIVLCVMRARKEYLAKHSDREVPE